MAISIKRGGEWIEARLLASGPRRTRGSKNAARALCAAFAHWRDHMLDHQARLKPNVSIRELVMEGHQLEAHSWA